MSDVLCVTGHDPAVQADVGYLCVECFSRLRSSLLELPAVATWLHCNLAAGGAASGERVSGSREDPIPLRVDVLDLIGPVAPDPSRALFDDPEIQAGDPSMFDELRSWCVLVEEETGYDWDDRRTLTGTVAYLAARLSWIAGQPWVDEFAAAVRNLSTRAHRVAPWRAEVRRDPDPCPRCGVRAVVLHIAVGESRCERRAGGCGQKRPLTEYVLNAVLPKTRRAG